ncbi:MAG: cell division protein FtsL [Spirochaetaceae bacterium]|nr:cell division protein FtsL [Spirochaetaceae bacterium]MBQ7367069.1 cell division protein FtsL [Spirochaetaceae bacterium]MBQ8384465.1 cell division protein FtsL [Spirochaetaceae bacterium]MBQ8560189.1 cell division protein FtsL [Spirochaetaceae bacterium]MBR2462177.1 cell division protein FtsL [Spirochaetaceae bacterium]
MKQKSALAKGVAICMLAASIPLFLAVDGVQARRFAQLEQEIAQLERRQAEMVEENKNLITGISVLSSADRIEALASGQLGMRPAESSEIIRVEMGGR